MLKTLKKVGNSHALFLDKAILELLKIDADTPLELRIEDGVLIVVPVHDPRKHRQIDKVMEGIRKRYSKSFKKLAE